MSCGDWLLRSCSSWSPSLVAQGGDGIEAGGAPRGNDACNHPEDRAEADREEGGARGQVEEDGAARTPGLVGQDDD